MEQRTNNAKQFHHQYTAKRLNKAKEQETHFANIMKERYYFSVSGATENQNKYEHWDVALSHPSDNHQEIRYVDVKTVNKKYPNLVVIELQNNWGYPGWLYQVLSENHFLAFDFQKEFLVVKTDAVRKWVDENINIDICVKGTISPAIYKDKITFSRDYSNVNDKLCLMTYDDLISIGAIIIKK